MRLFNIYNFVQKLIEKSRDYIELPNFVAALYTNSEQVFIEYKFYNSCKSIDKVNFYLLHKFVNYPSSLVFQNITIAIFF